MRILFFIESLRAGGKERRLTELIKGLRVVPYIEYEIVVMSSDIHYQDILKLNIKIHSLIRKTKKDLSVFKRFYQLTKIYKPDIIHCWDDMTAVIAVPACKMLGIKLVNGMVIDTPVHQNIFNKYWLRAKLTFPFSDVIIGNSKAGLCAYGAPAKKSLVIYNGYNFERNKNLSDRTEIRNQLNISTRFIISMVATNSDKKDYKTYLKAAEIVLSKRNDVTFLAIGEKTDSLDLENLVNKNIIGNKIRFLGKKKNVEDFINITDVGVLATYTEGISNSILEFMALGKPVIATDGGGTIEILQECKTGYLVKPYDSAGLAFKIGLLLENENKRIEMGKFAQKRIEDVFSIKLMVDNFLSIYSKLLKTNLKLTEDSKKIRLLS
ncbi:MAG: glycosyltransferase [Ferruginibacter sp.]